MLAEDPTVARKGIEHSQVVQWKRRLVPPVDHDMLARIVPPIYLQERPLRRGQPGEPSREPLDPDSGFEFLRFLARVPSRISCV